MLIKKYVAVLNVLANGIRAFKWKLCWHWLKDLQEQHTVSVILIQGLLFLFLFVFFQPSWILVLVPSPILNLSRHQKSWVHWFSHQDCRKSFYITVICRQANKATVYVQDPRACFNIKTIIPGIRIPITKISQSQNRLIFVMAIHLLARWHLYIERGPCLLWINPCQLTKNFKPGFWLAGSCQPIRSHVRKSLLSTMAAIIENFISPSNQFLFVSSTYMSMGAVLVSQNSAFWVSHRHFALFIDTLNLPWSK